MKAKQNWQHSLHMIWAIALKDIVDAVQNKTVIGIMIGVALMIFSSQALALLARGQEEPLAVIFDQGSSTSLREIVRSRELRLRLVDSLAELESQVSQSAVPVLGLVIPPDFDDRITGGAAIEVPGYLQHWVKPAPAAELVLYFEEHLTAAFEQTLRIQTAGNALYPDPNQMGFSLMISTGLVLGVMTTGLTLVPILMIEEKETHTLDALLISPARPLHLMLGKSLAGLFYSLVAATVIFVFSGYWIVHWGVVLLAVILGAFCAVFTGLMAGNIFESTTTVNMWMGIIIAFFLLPVFLWGSISPKLPEALLKLLEWLPSLAMFRMVGLSLAKTIPPQQLIRPLAAMSAYILVLMALVSWRIRQIER
ncbi:MAG TPA: hypothetical protein DEH25_01930 [Chloroflexi bacterium]|nr:hypothetical protein [Chloroflexota bacterium]HBY09413.1 hypothetical protein [Chloroflexota bacterium]